MRAFLAARATMARFMRRRSRTFRPQTLSLSCLSPRFVMTAIAPCTKSVLRYLSPRLLIRPNRGFPPVEYCLGTNPSQAAKSLPESNCSPFPIVAIIAVAVCGPMPRTSRIRWALGLALVTISKHCSVSAIR